MSKSIFNSDVFNSKNMSNSNTLPDINITDLVANTATIGTITNAELQAATSGVANNATNLTGITYATSGDLTTIDNNVSVTGTITNTELQAATSGDTTNATNIASNTTAIISLIAQQNTNIGAITLNQTTAAANATAITSLVAQQTTNIGNIADNTTALTGITYAASGDLTTIDNNVSVTGTITNTELQAATTNLTGITYAASGDLTTIDNNVSVTGTITNTELQAATTNLTGITYAASGDLTTIDNNVSITGTVTNTELQAATANLTGITYAASGDLTTIDNNVTIGTSKVLAIPNYTNVETTLTSLSNQQSTNTSALTGITYTTSSDLTAIDNHVSITRDFNHTPRMFRINFDKDEATNNLWGGDNVADTVKQSVQTGTAFHSGISNGLITISVAGFYRIKYQASVENDGQNGRITAGAFLKVNSTGYWKNDDHSFFASVYIRDDQEGDMASFQFEDYKDLAVNDVISFPTKLNLGTNTGFTDTVAEGNLDWFGGVTLELIKTN
jgi:hypothetical protein